MHSCVRVTFAFVLWFLFTSMTKELYCPFHSHHSVSDKMAPRRSTLAIAKQNLATEELSFIMLATSVLKKKCKTWHRWWVHTILKKIHEHGSLTIRGKKGKMYVMTKIYGHTHQSLVCICIQILLHSAIEKLRKRTWNANHETQAWNQILFASSTSTSSSSTSTITILPITANALHTQTELMDS